MPFPLGYTALLSAAKGDGNAIAATTTKTSLLTGSAATGIAAVPANWFQDHTALYIRAAGRLSTPAATQGNITFQVAYGGVDVAVTPTFVNLASLTNITWILDWHLLIRAVGGGTSASIMHTGYLHSANVSATNLVNLIPATAPAVGTGFSTLAASNMDLTCQWSNATAGNTIQLHMCSIWIKNTY